MLHTHLKEFLADKADDMKAENIVTLDVIDKSSVTDYMVICTGTSKRHVSSIAHNVATEAKNIGLTPYGIDGEKEGAWIGRGGDPSAVATPSGDASGGSEASELLID